MLNLDRWLAGLFLSTLSLRRATFRQNYECFEWIISIHALLAESDTRSGCCFSAPRYFYPRSPCGERLIASVGSLVIFEFLSTLSLRRATLIISVVSSPGKNFYPRSPCGERLYDTYAKVLRVNISIHALLAESDDCNAHGNTSFIHFYPRSPCGERQHPEPAGKAQTLISIHALLAESDGCVGC